MAKSVDELTFTDDGMFQAVMHDPKICFFIFTKALILTDQVGGGTLI